MQSGQSHLLTYLDHSENELQIVVYKIYKDGILFSWLFRYSTSF